MRLVVVVGRHWPPSSSLGRPRDGPALMPSADVDTFDTPRLNLSRRQSATTAGAPIDYARVCLAPPPRTSAMLSVPSTTASRDGRPVTRALEPDHRGLFVTGLPDLSYGEIPPS